MATEKEIAGYTGNDCNESAVNGAKSVAKASKMCCEFYLGEKYMLPSEEC